MSRTNTTSSMIDSTVVDTPAGPFTVLVGPDGAVRASGFTADPANLLPLVHPSLRGEPRHRPDLGPVSAAVADYLDGDLAAIDDVPVEQHTGGAFMAHAWQVLRDVKPGARSPTPGTPPWPAGPSRYAPPPRPAPATPPRFSSPVTGCCAPTARSAATAGGCR